MEDRNDKGQFVKGRIEAPLVQKKRLDALKASVEKRKGYLGELKSHPLYNIWRSFRFTQKGKKSGNSEQWDDFKTFYGDVLPSYEVGKRFNRVDITKPYSRDNFIFLTDEEVAWRLRSSKLLTYKGRTQSLEEWIVELDLNEGGVKQRYFRGKKHGHSAERVLFGYKFTKAREMVDYRELGRQQVRSKASKMISAYNNKDKKRGFEKSDLAIDWVIENIFKSVCFYCGDTNRIGADRISNDKNHDMDNVVPCCYECNVARGNNFTLDEMKIIGKAIQAVKSNRKLLEGD